MLRAREIPVFSADEWAREAVKPGGDVLERLKKRYGDEIVASDGELDRKRLRKYLLASDKEKAHIEQIIHPVVLQFMDRDLTMAKEKGTDMAVVEVPLLYETGMEGLFDLVLVVTAPLEERLKRIIKRNNVSESEARRWLSAQVPQETRVKLADMVIKNNGSIDELEEKVLEFIKGIRDISLN